MFKLINNTFFSRKLDFRVRLFNILAVIGIFVSLASTAASFILGEPAGIALIYACFALLSAWLLWYSAKSGKYQLCYFITIVVIFMIGFPVFFFMTGAYFGTLPYFFIFAIVFTVFMLEGATALIVAAVELLVYAGICLYAYGRYVFDEFYMSGSLVVIDTIFSFTIVSAALGLCIFLHFRLYNRQQRELETAWEESKRLSEVKNVFLANMSHEIRTPINVMLGMTEMVLRDSSDETIRDYAGKIQNSGSMLLVLVSNLLDVSKIESGKLEMSEDRYRVSELIKELYEVGAESSRKKGLSFSVQVDDDLPSELWGDLLRLKQVAANFLSNATKYTDSGSVVLKFSRKETSNSGVIMLCISVADTGIGIRDENLPLLFDAFTRVELPAGRYIEGTGLGLAIAKDLTELMHGQIGVESEYGSGSEFWVEIPQTVVDERPTEDWRTSRDHAGDGMEESFTAPDARILIVDDNADNRQTIGILLKRTLLRVDMAGSGAECLEAVARSDYDVILMDYMMPDMDGLETLRRLREGNAGFRTPVIALTANAVAGVEDKLIAEGFASFITKPVQARILEDALAAHLPAGLVTQHVISRESWVPPELKETLARDLAVFGVSLAEGLRNASGDLSLLARMADVFAQGCGESITELREAFPGAGGTDRLGSLDTGRADFEKLRHAAHSLKSRAGFVGAESLQNTAQTVEQLCADLGADDPGSGAAGDNARAVELAIPLLLLLMERAAKGLKAFAAHVHAVEPRER